MSDLTIFDFIRNEGASISGSFSAGSEDQENNNFYAATDLRADRTISSNEINDLKDILDKKNILIYWGNGITESLNDYDGDFKLMIDLSDYFDDGFIATLLDILYFEFDAQSNNKKDYARRFNEFVKSKGFVTYYYNGYDGDGESVYRMGIEGINIAEVRTQAILHIFDFIETYDKSDFSDNIELYSLFENYKIMKSIEPAESDTKKRRL